MAYVVLINIRNTYVTYAHCGPIHFNRQEIQTKTPESI